MLKDEPHICYHCGNTGILKYICEIDSPESIDEYDEYGQLIFHQVIENVRWYFFQCPVCNNPVLISEYTCEAMPVAYRETKNEFPTVNICYDGVPNNIRHAFDSAIKTRGIDKAICLLSLRRTLEMICNDKGAQGKTLEKKINDLVNKKVLPEMMKDACWIVRQNGNDAAHAEEVVFTEYEVSEVIEYVATIINYLYSMPIRLSKTRKRIELRKEGK